MPEAPTEDANQGVDPHTFRHALGRFATGVSVITALGERGEGVGVTVSALASLSLEPPLLLFCLDRSTARLDVYERSAAFGVNILAAGQQSVSELFASQREDKFVKTAHRAGASGCLLIDGCLANLECVRLAVHDGGDHRIFVVRVDRVDQTEADPLLYFRGGYRRLVPLT